MVILAGAAATSALGQAAALAAGPAEKATQSAGYDPGFFRQVGRNAFNFEPLPDGPQPGGEPGADARWHQQTSASSSRFSQSDPEAETRHRHEEGEISKSGQAYPDASNQCRPTTRRSRSPCSLDWRCCREGWHHHDHDQDDQVRRVA